MPRKTSFRSPAAGRAVIETVLDGTGTFLTNDERDFGAGFLIDGQRVLAHFDESIADREDCA